MTLVLLCPSSFWCGLCLPQLLLRSQRLFDLLARSIKSLTCAQATNIVISRQSAADKLQRSLILLQLITLFW